MMTRRLPDRDGRPSRTGGGTSKRRLGIAPACVTAARRGAACAAVLVLGVLAGSVARAETPAEMDATLAAPASTDQAIAEPASTEKVHPDDDPDALPPPVFAPLAAHSVGPTDRPPASVFTRARLRPPAAPVRVDPSWPAGRGPWRDLVDREAARFGLPADLIEAVMMVESANNPATIGADGEIGLMQVMPATARMLGFAGTDGELATPEINIHYGVRYLAGAWRLAGKDICTAVMKYRAGHGETRFSYRSVAYCVRVRGILAVRGFPVTGLVPEPTFGESAGTAGPTRGSGARGGRIDFGGLNTRLRAAVDRIVVHTVR